MTSPWLCRTAWLRACDRPCASQNVTRASGRSGTGKARRMAGGVLSITSSSQSACAKPRDSSSARTLLPSVA